MQRRFLLVGATLVWLLFAASFLMPVAKAIDVTGATAFWHYLSEMLDVLDYWRQVQREPRLILASAFPSTNGLMFIAPVILFRWPRWSGLAGGILSKGTPVDCTAPRIQLPHCPSIPACFRQRLHLYAKLSSFSA